MKYISVGQATYDITLMLDKLPLENTKIKTKERVCCGGGSASNSAYLLALWNQSSYFAGTIGNDREGEMIEKELKDKQVNLKYLSKQNINTPISYILSNKNKKTRTVITYKEKENALINKIKIDKDFDCIILDGYEKEFADQVLFENQDAISILDAGRVNIDMVDLAYKVDYIITSKTFAYKYTNIEIKNKNDLIKIYDNLYNRFNSNIIITLEDKGCFTKINGKYILVPTIKVDSIDTTGAGDIFHAAFAYFITHNYDLLDTLRLSNLTASLSTKYIGSRNSIVSLDEVLKLYNELYK